MTTTTTQPTSRSDLMLPSTVPSSDIVQRSDFVSSEEAEVLLNLLDDISDNDHEDDGEQDQDQDQVAVGWQVEGYERRRRVQRYSGALLEKHFRHMMDRVVDSIQGEQSAQHVPRSSCTRMGRGNGIAGRIQRW